MSPVRKIPGKEHLGALTSIVDDAEATVSARLTTVLVDSYSFPYVPFIPLCPLLHALDLMYICSPLSAFAHTGAWPGFIWPCFSSVRQRALFFPRAPFFTVLFLFGQFETLSFRRAPTLTALLSLAVRREHCRALQSFLLLKQGDFIQSLMTLVAEELAKPAVRPSFCFGLLSPC